MKQIKEITNYNTDFYKKVIPFCRYCKVNKQVENLPFEISKKEKDEWI